jgi:hypothetical protein
MTTHPIPVPAEEVSSTQPESVCFGERTSCKMTSICGPKMRRGGVWLPPGWALQQQGSCPQFTGRVKASLCSSSVAGGKPSLHVLQTHSNFSCQVE